MRSTGSSPRRRRSARTREAPEAGRCELRRSRSYADGDVIEGLRLAHAQLAEADNMADRLGALATIAMKPDSAREHALEAFGRRYAMEPLILDKWFALQAQIPERETLDRVRGLMSHRGFSMANPNRVRALIGGFAANHTQFNRADGAGFALLEEIVVGLDPSNPQIAARLLTAMRSWRSLEEVRRRQAEAMLKRIAAQATLSPRRARHRDPQPGLRRTPRRFRGFRTFNRGENPAEPRQSWRKFGLSLCQGAGTKIRTRILIVLIRAWRRVARALKCDGFWEQ